MTLEYLKSTRLAGILRAGRRALIAPLQRRRDKAAFMRMTDLDAARLAFYGALVNRGDLVFDVGANRGNRSKIFLMLGARVVALEPQPDCAAYLTAMLGSDKMFTLVPKALGQAEGHAEMAVSDTSVLSSLSPDWIAATKASGRFASHEWARKIQVPLTTLDRVIEERGVPAFAKIDVEGFELEVLLGLSRPISCISIEFTPEYSENSHAALQHLMCLGPVEVQVSYGESMKFHFADWQPPEVLVKSIFEARSRASGDIYIRSLSQ